MEPARDREAEISELKTDLAAAEKLVEKLRYQLKEASKAGTALWHERDAQNGMLLENQLLMAVLSVDDENLEMIVKVMERSAENTKIACISQMTRAKLMAGDILMALRKKAGIEFPKEEVKPK